MSYPDFVCIGFQKCGTTTLYDLLKEHPQVALCRDVKEPMIFRTPDWFNSLLGGAKYYEKRYFGHIRKGDGRLLGEINAGLGSTGCAERLHRYYPKDTKMIFMMRDPADRSYSAYKYFLARGFLPPWVMKYDTACGHAAGFDRYVHWVLDDEERRADVMNHRMTYQVLSQSRYGVCIGDYLKYFDRKNMMFIIFEDFIRDQEKTCRQLYDFLGLDDAPDIPYGVKSNEGNERSNSYFKCWLYFNVKSFKYFIYDFLAISHWAPTFYYKYFTRFLNFLRDQYRVPDTDREKMLPETRACLQEYYKDDVRMVERLMGRDLGMVWKTV